MSEMEPIRVALVDDQELFRAEVAVVVGAQPDLEVVGQAADGRDGLAVIARTRPDVVLMDVRMPRMGGVEATRELFSSDGRAGPRPRVVLLTTFELDQAAAEAIRLGASGSCSRTPPLSCSARRSGRSTAAARLSRVGWPRCSTWAWPGPPRRPRRAGPSPP